MPANTTFGAILVLAGTAATSIPMASVALNSDYALPSHEYHIEGTSYSPIVDYRMPNGIDPVALPVFRRGPSVEVRINRPIPLRLRKFDSDSA